MYLIEGSGDGRTWGRKGEMVEFTVQIYKMEKFGKWIKAIFTTCTYAARTVAEPPNLMPHRSACLPLDTKHSRENTKLLSSIGHTLGENPKIHIFAIRITNERIKLTSF